MRRTWFAWLLLALVVLLADRLRGETVPVRADEARGRGECAADGRGSGAEKD